MSAPNLAAIYTKAHSRVFNETFYALEKILNENKCPDKSSLGECCVSEAEYRESKHKKSLVITHLCYIWDMDFADTERLAEPLNAIDGVKFVYITKIMREPGTSSDMTDDEEKRGLMTVNDR